MSGFGPLTGSSPTTPVRRPGRFLPPERHAARTSTVTWANGTTQTIDFSADDDALGWPFIPRCVHVNNLSTNGNVHFLVTANGFTWQDWVASGHTRVIYPPPAQPFSMIAVGEPIQTGQTVLTFYNYVLPPTQDSIISQAGLFYVVSDANEVEARAPDKFFGAPVASTSTWLWTPAAGRSPRLLQVVMYLSNDAEIAVAGTYQAQIKGSVAGGLALYYQGYVPAAPAPAVGITNPVTYDLGPGGISLSPNEQVGVGANVALTAGHLIVTLMGTED